MSTSTTYQGEHPVKVVYQFPHLFRLAGEGPSLAVFKIKIYSSARNKPRTIELFQHEALCLRYNEIDWGTVREGDKDNVCWCSKEERFFACVEYGSVSLNYKHCTRSSRLARDTCSGRLVERKRCTTDYNRYLRSITEGPTAFKYLIAEGSSKAWFYKPLADSILANEAQRYRYDYYWTSSYNKYSLKTNVGEYFVAYRRRHEYFELNRGDPVFWLPSGRAPKSITIEQCREAVLKHFLPYRLGLKYYDVWKELADRVVVARGAREGSVKRKKCKEKYAK